ncbi:TIGR01440 family protein [Periweissella fabalis]|uniref:UPF0340 protein HF964_00305 n=1 Tax=Periweissella fabalis TaxID=1070421 RepID=A0A7X6N3L7_9LACO|nr:TIGR01440 family protein [Periweissella fabalis]MCM0598978.1 TIGR01440 family protein [Periweissella fabalis]NKZ23258.1 TIGR01440 family protein [Periweissella fabalis]
MLTIEQIQADLKNVLDDYFAQVAQPGKLFVVGCSTSEIRGDWKGTNSSLDVGQVVYKTIQEYLEPRGIAIAIQGCEHLNRALLVERVVAEANNFEIVDVVPAMHAGGGTQVAAYQRMDDPVEVEHIVAQGGIDIGGTEIGMHVKFVQIPVPLQHRDVGAARVVALTSRPKKIGGMRAQYQFTAANLEE